MLEFTGTNQKEKILVEKGTYDCILTASWQKTKAGDKYINCKFKIRSDVNQRFQNAVIFDGIYKSKNSDELSANKINGILSAIPNPKLSFENYDELIQYISDKPMLVDIDIEPADPTNNTTTDRNIIKYLSYAISPNQTVAGAGVSVLKEVTDDDGLIPF